MTENQANDANYKDLKRKVRDIQENIERKKLEIDSNQKSIAEKRATVPKVLEELLLQEKFTLIEHYLEGELKLDQDTLNIDFQMAEKDILRRTNAEKVNSEQERLNAEKLKIEKEEINKLNEQVDQMAKKLIMKYS